MITEESILKAVTDGIRITLRQGGLQAACAQWTAVNNMLSTEEWWPPVARAVKEQLDAYAAEQTEDEPGSALDMADVAQAVTKCKPFLWGNSALAVAFAVCRDEYGMGDNMNQFERKLQEQGVECPAGTLANAMKNNPYMKMPTDRWRANGAKERVMVLLSALRKCINEC
jgi:hypothetical protein